MQNSVKGGFIWKRWWNPWAFMIGNFSRPARIVSPCVFPRPTWRSSKNTNFCWSRFSFSKTMLAGMASWKSKCPMMLMPSGLDSLDGVDPISKTNITKKRAFVRSIQHRIMTWFGSWALWRHTRSCRLVLAFENFQLSHSIAWPDSKIWLMDPCNIPMFIFRDFNDFFKFRHPEGHSFISLPNFQNKTCKIVPTLSLMIRRCPKNLRCDFKNANKSSKNTEHGKPRIFHIGRFLGTVFRKHGRLFCNDIDPNGLILDNVKAQCVHRMHRWIVYWT